jgi:putative ABC transport system ATP-binding protein
VTAPLVEASGLTRTFQMGGGPVHALRDVSLRIDPGEYVAIQGPSGCGKSTLLHILGCVDTPTSGSLVFDGRPVGALPDAARSAIRLLSIGFVFQRFFLLPMLTASENIDVPQAEAGVRRAERRRRTAELLEYVGLAHRAHHRPAQLSGGEAQRVAVARALANRPRLLLADEPTGELDQATGAQVAALLDRVQADGTAVVVVTHDAAIAARAARTLSMRDGRLKNGPIEVGRPAGSGHAP